MIEILLSFFGKLVRHFLIKGFVVTSKSRYSETIQTDKGD